MKTFKKSFLALAILATIGLVSCNKDKDDQNSTTPTSNYTKFSFAKAGNQWKYVQLDQNGVVTDSIQRKCSTIDANGKCLIEYSDLFGQMTEYWYFTPELFGEYPDETKDYFYKIVMANSKAGDVLTNEDGIQIKVLKTDTTITTVGKSYSCFKIEILAEGKSSLNFYINPKYGIIRSDDLESGNSEVLVSTNF